MQATVTYLHHSGFSVKTPGHYLVFDYDGTQPGPDKHLLREPGAAVFASHRHPDHFRRQILEWKREIPSLTLVLSDDIRSKELAVRLGPHQRAELSGMEIATLRSTDLGVAFVVKADGLCIYHGGDLNWWHWNGEPDSFNRPMEEQYKQEIRRLKGQAIDLAFLPTDPRQEDAEFWGLTYFMETVGAKIVAPMHRWDDESILDRLSALWREKGWKARLLLLKTPGEKADFSF